MPKRYTIGELIKISTDYLRGKGCASPRLDAELLLGFVLDLDRLTLYLNFDKPLNEGEIARYRVLIGRRGQRVPVAYLTGRREFYSLALEVNEAVLIPRPETEFLVEKVLELVESAGKVKILELGTGSGAAAVALAYENPDLMITAVDISPAALQVAQGNAERFEVDCQIRFVQSDLFEKAEGKYKVICSNPPYVPRGELAELGPEVGHEPVEALDGGRDGLHFYRLILNQASAFLESPGFVVLEIAWNQAEAIKSLGEQAGLEWKETIKDYGEQERVVVFGWT